VLDWDGAEDGQGRSSTGVIAGGSPTVWTTNDHSHTQAYHPLNKYDACSSSSGSGSGSDSGSDSGSGSSSSSSSKSKVKVK